VSSVGTVRTAAARATRAVTAAADDQPASSRDAAKAPDVPKVAVDRSVSARPVPTDGARRPASAGAAGAAAVETPAGALVGLGAIGASRSFGGAPGCDT